MLKNKLQIFLTIVFLGFVGWWISFQHVVTKQGSSVNWFENVYGVVALIGAIVGFVAVKKWGGAKSVIGKALIFFSLGLFAQEAGQLISSYYTQIDKVALPYPSFGDVGYFGGVLLYICGAFFLTKAVGTRISLKKNGYKTIAILVPIILLVVSYRFLLYHQPQPDQWLTVFLNFGYPLGQALYISLAIVAYLLSFKSLGGVIKSGILLIIAGLVVQYLADFTFLYQGSRGTYVPGKYDDLFYLIAYFLMATALIKFLSIYNEIKAKTTSSNKGHQEVGA